MTLKRLLPLEGKLLDSTTMRSRKHYITDRMIESYFVACHIKRHMRHLERLMTVCAELTNLVQSLEIDSEDLGIIGRR